MKKHIQFILILLLTGALSLSAQSGSGYPEIQRSTDWVLYQEADGVQLFYRFAECNLPSEGYYREKVLLKLVNITNLEKTVDWDVVLWYGPNCVNCDEANPEQHKTVVLAPGTTREATCELDKNFELKLFSRFLNYQLDDWVLTHFELRNFTVK